MIAAIYGYEGGWTAWRIDEAAGTAERVPDGGTADSTISDSDCDFGA